MLRGMGAALALPWFDSLVGRSWGGQVFRSGNPPVRMAFVYAPNGMHMPDWSPTQFGSAFDLPPILQPLAAFRDQMNVLSGLTLDGARAHGDGGGDHARALAAFLTGAHPIKTHGANIKNGISVDQLAASQLVDQTRFASLELGIEGSALAGNCDSGYSCAYSSNISWRNESTPVPKETNPVAVFDRLVGSDLAKDGAVNSAQRRALRKSVLDYVLDDAHSLERKLAAGDREKLDEYLHAVRDIERRVSMPTQLNDSNIDLSKIQWPSGNSMTFEEHVKLMYDMMVLAFQTDSTRIITMMLGNDGTDRKYTELGIRGGHHELSHHGNNEAKQASVSKINQFHTTLLVHLIDRLQTIPEGDGNLLQNCMVVYGSGIADGNIHNHDNLPILLFGQGGGTIATGRHIEYPAETPLTNLYVSMLDRMGLSADAFGDSTGALAQLDG
jgi:hypothetical protein